MLSFFNGCLSERLFGVIAAVLMLSACGGSGEPFQDSLLLASQSDSIDEESEAENQLLAELNAEVAQLVELAGGDAGAEAFILPSSDDYDAIPQDPSNPLSAEKVELGQLLFHDTAFGNNGNNPDRSDTYSCASCHHAAAGFKAGIPQGIGEGGDGFGINGEARLLAPGFDAELAADHPMKPDIQPLASPTILNSAYQEVMLWNGQFGNPIDGVINNAIDDAILSTAGTPKEANLQRFAGLETQALAGLGVHRMNVETDSLLQTNSVYRDIYQNAYGISSDVDQALENSAKSIAAYERTVLANEAPFQQWLRGDSTAMTVAELTGAKLFFGKANCTDCHRGPALSSEQGASAAQMFFSIGFGDFDTEDERIHGSVSDADSRGRGGFTGNPEDNFKFKIPQLYNLADTNVFGHGARLQSIREVVEYKNAAIPHASLNDEVLSEYFVPLNLSDEEVGDLTEFLSSALYDANLERYVPNSVPSGQCIPVNDVIAREDLACE